MRILILGATGRTGRLVQKKASKTGFEINCLVRNPEKVETVEKVNVFRDNPAQIEDLDKAMNNCEAIINVLNICRNSDFPWSKLRTP